jgi:hypothetical protein
MKYSKGFIIIAIAIMVFISSCGNQLRNSYDETIELNTECYKNNDMQLFLIDTAPKCLAVADIQAHRAIRSPQDYFAKIAKIVNLDNDCKNPSTQLLKDSCQTTYTVYTGTYQVSMQLLAPPSNSDYTQ